MIFTDKIVVVTGAAKGIGSYIAKAYAESGATVVLLDKDTTGQEVAEGIVAQGGKASFAAIDLACAQSIPTVFQNILNNYNRIDILINNAGLVVRKSPYQLTIEEWDQVINVNLRAPFICAREAALGMRKAGGGSIVNISSTRAYMSEANTESYSASKGGLNALTHALALSLAPDYIRVNSVSPGWIETGDYQKLTSFEHLQHPARRVGRPADVVKACFYLTDPSNSFVTGTDIIVDGGMTKKMIYFE